jgi:DNA-binding response OmpR family regulator
VTRQAMTPPKVLLIDSDVDSIAIYSLILRHHGFVVIQALDPDTGFQLAVEDRPDLVITEIFLPPVRGTTLLERLLDDARTSSTPLIVLDSVPSIGEYFVSSGRIQHRLTKPCEPSRLLTEVQKLLEQSVPIVQ